MTFTNRPTHQTILQVLAVSAALALVITGLGRPAVSAENDPSSLPIPSIAGELANSEKALIARVTVTPDDVALVSSDVVDGPAPRHVGAPNQMRYELEQSDGTAVASYHGWYPRHVEGEDDGSGAGGMSVVELPSAEAFLSFPFDPRAHTIDVHDLVHGQPLGSVNVTDAIVDYCTDEPADPACATDLSVTGADDHDPAVAGEQVTYTLTVSNAGANPAQDVRLTDVLPAGLTYAGSDPRCSAVGQTVTCDLAVLYAGDAISVDVPADIDADLVHVAGAPVTVSNSAHVDNLAGDDPEMANDDATMDTRVEAVADLSVDDVVAVDAPDEIVIGEPVIVDVASTLGNGGPSAPMDVRTTTAALAGNGAAVTPAATSALDPAVALGEGRVHTDAYELSCQTPGAKDFSFTTSVTPDRPDDTDPNSTNDTGQTTITVDCLMPVALNIHPGSAVNPINARAKNGVVPAAVLTTTAGEYGLPLPFDATSIDALSVRFGPRTVIDGGAGAFEKHSSLHPQDTVERSDERTVDGDTDAALHFDTPKSGIAPGDTEACARGEFRATDGEVYRFIGCDVVRAF